MLRRNQWAKAGDSLVEKTAVAPTAPLRPKPPTDRFPPPPVVITVHDVDVSLLTDGSRSQRISQPVSLPFKSGTKFWSNSRCIDAPPLGRKCRSRAVRAGSGDHVSDDGGGPCPPVNWVAPDGIQPHPLFGLSGPQPSACLKPSSRLAPLYDGPGYGP